MIPAVKGLLTGMDLRVPTIDVPRVTLAVEFKKRGSPGEIFTEMERRSEDDVKASASIPWQASCWSSPS